MFTRVHRESGQRPTHTVTLEQLHTLTDTHTTTTHTHTHLVVKLPRGMLGAEDGAEHGLS